MFHLEVKKKSHNLQSALRRLEFKTTSYQNHVGRLIMLWDYVFFMYV